MGLNDRPSSEVAGKGDIPLVEEGGLGEGKANVLFTPSKGLTTAEAEALLLIHGKNQIENKKKSKVRRAWVYVIVA